MDGERGWDTERAICRPIKFLGGRGGMKCQEWRLRMSILDLSSSRPTIRSCNKDGIPRTDESREHYKFLRHLIRPARCPSSVETFLGELCLLDMTEVGLYTHMHAFKLLLVFPSRSSPLGTFSFGLTNERTSMHVHEDGNNPSSVSLPLSVCLSPRKLEFSSDSVPVRNLNPLSTRCHKR